MLFSFPSPLSFSPFLRFLVVFLILFICQLDLYCSTSTTPKKIGKGYRLTSIEESSNGGIVGLLQDVLPPDVNQTWCESDLMWVRQACSRMKETFKEPRHKKRAASSSPLPFSWHQNLPLNNPGQQRRPAENRLETNKKDLHLLCHITASQTAGTHLDCHGGSTDFGLNLYKVRLPNTACMIVWLTYIVTAHGTLAANLTSSGHNKPAYKISEAIY